MDWIKQVIVDIGAFIVIIIAVSTDNTYLAYVVYSYTILMALARLLSLLSSNLRSLSIKGSATVPVWFYHITYAATLLLLLVFEWYITSAGWIFIWIAAIIAYKKDR